jgi:Rrf2 family protein
MSHITTGVEYGLHCLLYLVDEVAETGTAASTRDLADLQGVPAEYVAKLFTKLQKAGVVAATEGAKGGFRLARPAGQITVLDVVDAIDGEKPLFECREIRGRCALYNDNPPDYATRGVCSIHAIMLDAEKRMREALAAQTLASLSRTVVAKQAPDYTQRVADWLEDRAVSRRPAHAR